VPKHIAIYSSNNENKKELIKRILSGQFNLGISSLTYELYSDITLNTFLDEEMRHGHSGVETSTKNSLKNSSQGERKKALLKYIIAKKTECIILDNVYDSLDIESQKNIKKTFINLNERILIVQITNRKQDIFPFINTIFQFHNGELIFKEGFNKTNIGKYKTFTKALPEPLTKKINPLDKLLIKLRDINVSYGGRPILNNISWTINQGEFWQLIGPNGSGKSTILSLIFGDNPKGYNQDLILFGMKKGSGESVWDIKKHIGFFSSDMLIGFKRKDSLENMIISGFLDSVGLYKIPNERQISIAHQWLKILNLFNNRNQSFSTLSEGHKRLVLIARAMVKQPPLLILDEPINGLDDHDAEIFSELVNKIAAESNTAIIYVSHRAESSIKPDFIYKLIPNETGSTGEIIKT
jgi:molybdate transport system ATP-binding protein